MVLLGILGGILLEDSHLFLVFASEWLKVRDNMLPSVYIIIAIKQNMKIWWKYDHEQY